jgi:hypothetical protein
MQENNSCGKIMYMGNVQGPEKVNDSCVKTVHAEMIYRGFTVYFIWPLVMAVQIVHVITDSWLHGQ